MVALNTAYAPSKTSTRSQNRVGDFFCEAGERVGKNRLASRIATKEKTSCSYELASGRPYWPSRDPIEEWGGINLYGMVGNNPISRWDYLGLQGARTYNDTVLRYKRERQEIGNAAIDGAQAFVDGAVPFFDPLAAIGFYDASDSSLMVSQIIGGVTRDLVAVIGGGGLGYVFSEAGIATSIGSRAIMGSVGPSYFSLFLTGGRISGNGLAFGFTLKIGGYISTLLDIEELREESKAPDDCE